VGFIVVGGVAAIAHGGATFTRAHLDVLARFDVQNLTRLLAARRTLRPRFALYPARPAL